MLLNLFYTKSIYLGKEHHILRYATNERHGEEFTPLTIHIRNLIDAGKHNQTIRMAGPNIANFIDYFDEGLKHINAIKSEMNTLFRGYHSYLVHGEQSSSDVIRKICEAKPSPLVTVSSSDTYHSFVTPFLKNLEKIQSTYNSYIENGLEAEIPETSLLIESLLKISPCEIKIQRNEKHAMRRYATPATAANGLSENRISYTSHIPYQENFDKPIDEDQFFPRDKISDLISNAGSHRNAALYALMAATNARDCEADQILWQDINFASREILLVKPDTRKNPSNAYRGISELERNKLEWKGRSTPLTFLLEPYGTLFFYHLEEYIRH